MTKTRVLTLVFLGFLSSSCRSPEGLHVVIEGKGLSVGTNVSRLTLTAQRQNDAQVVLEETVTVYDGLTMPYLWNVVSGPQTPPGAMVRVSATAWWDGQLVAVASGAAQMKPGKGDSLTLSLLPPSVSLAFSSSPQTLSVGVCSSVFEINVSSALGEMMLALSSQPGVRFFSDSNCQDEISSVNVGAGETKARFWAKATRAGQYTVEAATNGRGVQQTLEIQAAPASSVLFLTSPQTVRADECSNAVELQLTDGQGLPLAPSTDIPLTLVSGQTGVSVNVFADAQCSTLLSTPLFTLSNPKVTAYFRGAVGGQASLLATATGYASVSQSHTILPLVRRGQCVMTQGSILVDCDISPSLVKLENAFLIFQVTHSETSAGAAVMQCQLNALDRIRCERGSTGEAATVDWQIVEKPDIEVQHVPFACTVGDVVNIPLAQTTVQSESFVLFSHSGPGVVLDGDDFASVQWRNSTTLMAVFGSSEGCVGRKGHVQVVRWPGTSVTRGLVSGISNNNATQIVPNLPVADVSRSFLLYGFHRSKQALGVCRSVFRGSFDESTVRFFRGGQNNLCIPVVPDFQGGVEGLFFERVTLPVGAKVQVRSAAMASTVNTLNVDIDEIEPSRTVVMTGGQAQSGQGGGESEHSSEDELGDAQVGTVLTGSTQLSVTRGQAAAAAAFEVFVIQL